jgi:FkbM family methyltransferase
MSLFKETFYKTINALTLGRGIERDINGEKIKFPAQWSKYYETDYEPDTFKFLRTNLSKGATFLDVGAHIGLFSVVAARLVGKSGKIFSFEPTPFTRNVLREVVELNGCSEIVELRGEAVSAQKGKTVFFDTGDSISNANSLVKTERSKNEIEISTISIDEFVKERNLKVGCIKIDAEGAELDVLRGAQKTFLTMRPAARLGLHPQSINQNGQTLEEIWDVLTEYKLKVVYGGKQIEKQYFCEQTNLFDVNLLPF